MVRVYVSGEGLMKELNARYLSQSDMYCIHEIREVSKIEQEYNSMKNEASLEELSSIYLRFKTAHEALSRKREEFHNSDIYKDYVRERNRVIAAKGGFKCI